MNTTTSQPVGIMAARLGRGDLVEFCGYDPRTVDEISLNAGRLYIEWTDGSRSCIDPCQMVTAWL